MNWIFLDVEKFNLNISRNGRKMEEDTTFHRKLNFSDFSNNVLTGVCSCTVSTVRLWGRAHSAEGLRWKTKSPPLWNRSIHSAELWGLESMNKKTEQTQASLNTPHLNVDNEKNRALILRSQTLTSAPLEKQVHHLRCECMAWMASANWIKRTRAWCFFDGDHTACSHAHDMFFIIPPHTEEVRSRLTVTGRLSDLWSPSSDIIDFRFSYYALN